MYDHSPYGAAVDDRVRYDDGAWRDDGDYGDGSYDQAVFDRAAYEQVTFDRAAYERASFEQAWRARAYFDEAPYEEAPYQQTRYGEAFFDDGAYQQAPYEQTLYEDSGNDDARFDQVRTIDEVRGEEPPHAGHDRPAPARRKPGAHRHARPSRKRRKPVRIAAAMAGSTLLVAGAVPAAAHWWHRPATHPDADQASLPTTPGTASGAQTAGQPATAQNALEQWAQIPIGKHVADEARVAQRAAKPVVKQPAPQPAHSPQPATTAAAAYQNPLRDVSGLVLERVDMGVDFGGSGPVFALGDGVITNAMGDSSGWPGGGWITYQLTDGPDKGLVVYLAEDVTPTVQVGQNVTSSTVIANMFNGGDGIETGWATADSSTAESQMAAAGGISGGGPFPTMVGLSFDAVLESVGVPAAPNADQAGNGLLPAGYPPT
jgi:hypothetical protein